MPLYTPPNLTSGLDDTLVETISTVPSFTPLFLLFVFGVVFLGGMVAQKRRIGFSDAPMWAVLGSISSLTIAIIMTLREGLIQVEVLGVVVAFTILSGFWFFTSRGRGET